MPIIRNPKHELFAQSLAKGKSQGGAYELAGYEPSEPHASRLARNGKVQARVAELQGRGAKRAEVTIESLLAEAAEIQAAALEAGQHSAAVAALTAKAKLSGLWVEKAENTNRNVDADRLTDAELAAIATGGSADPVKAPTSPTKLN